MAAYHAIQPRIIVEIDETSNPKTAKIAWQWPSAPDFYSYWGGSVVKLPNGNMEICMSDPYPDQDPFPSRSR